MPKQSDATQPDPASDDGSSTEDSVKPVKPYNEGTAADIRYNLEQSVKFVIVLNDTLTRAEPISKAVETFVDEKMDKAPKPSGPDNDPCTKPTPAIAPFCSALSLGKATSKLTYNQAASTAAGGLYTAVNTWDVALITYDSNIADATAALDSQVTAAYAQYAASLKAKPDAISRSEFLWWTLKGAIVTAVATYETSVQAAAGNLAAAAGAVLIAYTTYVSAINIAATTRLNTDCATQQTFWQNVESSRDH